MAFTSHGTLVPYGAPVLRKEIVANDVVLTVFDSVNADADGFIALGTAGAAVFGHAVGIVTNKDVGLNTSGVTGSEIGSFAGSFTMTSNNETVAKVRAEVDIMQTTLYSAEMSAALETSGGSNQLGVYFDLTDEDTLDESTFTDSTAQYHSFGIDPADSTRLVVNIFESSIFSAA